LDATENSSSHDAMPFLLQSGASGDWQNLSILRLEIVFKKGYNAVAINTFSKIILSGVRYD